MNDCVCVFKISQILQKCDGERTQEELSLLQAHQDTVQELSRRQSRRHLLKRKLEEVGVMIQHTDTEPRAASQTPYAVFTEESVICL